MFRPLIFRGPLSVLLLLVTAQSLAQSEPGGSALELALSNDTLQFRYLSEGSLLGVDDGRFFGSFFLSEERDTVLSAAMLFPVNFGIDRLGIRVGPQLYAALLEEENNDVFSMTLGADVRFVVLRKPEVAIRGQAFYGPDILTFGSADNLTDLSARVELQVAPRLDAFAGMRWFEFDLTDGSGQRTLQEEAFVGAGYRF